MAVMQTVGTARRRPAYASVREEAREYVIELDVSDFTDGELSVEALGPRVTVRGDQLETPEDETRPLRLHERLEESFRLPDDADPDRIRAFYKHGTLELHAPRTRRAPRSVPIEHPSYLVNPDAVPC